MQDYEKLGLFYLGRRYDMAGRHALDDMVLYDSRDLVTHAVCVGMTGSGKTGLCSRLSKRQRSMASGHRRPERRSGQSPADVPATFGRGVPAVGR